MPKNKGSALPQYAIIIALIALTLVPAFFLFGQTIYNSFVDFYNGLSGKETVSLQSSQIPENKPVIEGTPVSTNMSEGGILGGSPENPVQKCVNNNCTLDYGEFVLTGIPENFSNFIQSSGTSGGTEELLALIEQIAKQLEESGNTEGAAEFRDLANMGHYIANLQKEIEDRATNCASSSDQYNCYLAELGKNVGNVTIPPNLDHLGFDFAGAQNVELQEFYGVGADFGQAQGFYTSDPGYFQTAKNEYPSFAFVELYNKIANSDKYTDATKKVTRELYKYMGEINSELHNKVYHVKPEGTMTLYTKYDTVTGEASDIATPEFSISGFTNPITSQRSDVNSVLICATGKQDDKGHACY
ncbi:MAG: hypothetical protein AB1782_18255 [Cyanobacteriota bacterium]